MTFATIRRPSFLRDCAKSRAPKTRARARTSLLRVVPLLAATALFLPLVVRGQDNSSGPDPKAFTAKERTSEADHPRELIVRVYPVEDLLQTVADYPYRGGLPGTPQHLPSLGGMGGGGMGGGGMFSVPSDAAHPQVLRQFGGGGMGGLPSNTAQAEGSRTARERTGST